MGFEGANLGHNKQFENREDVPRGEPIESFKTQIYLMLERLKLKNPDLTPDVLDVLHPNKTSQELRRRAQREWVNMQEDGTMIEPSDASLYRAYTDAHPGERVDLTDEDALAALIRRSLEDDGRPLN